MTQFATAEDLSLYLRGDLNPDDAWTAQATLLLELVSADIASAAGAEIEAGEGTHLIAGSWSHDLDLPQRPVRQVDAVRVNGLALDVGAFMWNERQLIRRAAMFGTELDDDLGGWPDRTGAGFPAGGHWGGPASTVRVTYAWGYEEVPDVIRSMALRVAGRVIENPTSVTSEQLGAYSVQYDRQIGGSARGGSHLMAADIRALRKRFGCTGGTLPVRV